MTSKFPRRGGVPIPPSNNNKPSRYPWTSTNPGESFDVSVSRADRYRVQRALAGTAGHAWGNGKHATRYIRDDGVIRVWRLI